MTRRGSPPEARPAAAAPLEAVARGESAALRWRIFVVLLLVSVLPLGLMGGGAWVVLGRLLDAEVVELQRALVQSHAAAVEAHLASLRQPLEAVARTHRREDLVAAATLRAILDALSRSSAGAFVDLALVDADGRYLQYQGPNPPEAPSCHAAEWFREALARGSHTSDVVLDARGVPHFALALRERSAAGTWVLRATVDATRLDALVRAGSPGGSGEAYLVGRDGRYQTTPRGGSILDRAPFTALEPYGRLRAQRASSGGVATLRVTTWVDGGRWLLVVEQDAGEVRAPVNRALAAGAAVTALATLLVVVTTFLATGHLQRRVDRANAARDRLARAFMRSAKLASVGELAAGLAHEVNNPLAIIAAEHTNLTDLVGLAGEGDDRRREMLESLARIRAQVQRCAGITNKMLQFGRQQESLPEPTELGPHLEAIAALLGSQARAHGVRLEVEVDPHLPLVLVDPLELEQVVVNLVTNSFHATPRGGAVTLEARAAPGGVTLEVADTGHGMSPEVRERAFEPFFTTKPVGQGTGLGLAVCHGIVTGWGGTIDVDSEPGHGATFRIQLPAAGG